MNKHLLIILFFLLSACSSFGIFKSTPELHVIGVYEGTDPDNGLSEHSNCCRQGMVTPTGKSKSGGQVIVNVSITNKPIILAFTAYDKTKWIVRPENGVVIEKVILGGYHSQSIEGLPQNTPIEVYTHDSSPCSRCFHGGQYFYSYKVVPEELRSITEVTATSWQGKYRGLEFSIFPNMKQLEGPK